MTHKKTSPRLLPPPWLVLYFFSFRFVHWSLFCYFLLLFSKMWNKKKYIYIQINDFFFQVFLPWEPILVLNKSWLFGLRLFFRSFVRSFLCSFFLGFLCFFFCFVRGCCFIIATINAVKERSTSHLELELISPFHRQRKGPWLSEFCPKQETNGRNTL